MDDVSQRPETMAPLLNEAMLASRWRLSRRTLQRWRQLGLGPAYLRLGGRIAYSLDDVVAFEQAHRVASTISPRGSKQ
jgi:hypothetical protein